MTSDNRTTSDKPVQPDSPKAHALAIVRKNLKPKSGNLGCVIPNIEELIAAVCRAQRLKLITIKQVCERSGVGPTFVHAEMAAGRFPKPLKLSASKSRRAAARWVDGEISDWIQQHIDARDDANCATAGAKEVRMN